MKKLTTLIAHRLFNETCMNNNLLPIYIYIYIYIYIIRLRIQIRIPLKSDDFI